MIQEEDKEDEKEEIPRKAVLPDLSKMYEGQLLGKDVENNGNQDETSNNQQPLLISLKKANLSSSPKDEFEFSDTSPEEEEKKSESIEEQKSFNLHGKSKFSGSNRFSGFSDTIFSSKLTPSENL